SGSAHRLHGSRPGRAGGAGGRKWRQCREYREWREWRAALFPTLPPFPTPPLPPPSDLVAGWQGSYASRVEHAEGDEGVQRGGMRLLIIEDNPKMAVAIE